MENSYYTMYAGDYGSKNKTRPEKKFIDKETELQSNTSSDSLNDDLLSNDFKNKNENPSIISLQPGKTYVLQNQKKECLVKSNNAPENENIQHFENGKSMPLYTARGDDLSKDKRTMTTEQTNFTTRPNGMSFGSCSAPSIPSFASKQHLSGEGSNGNERPQRDFKNERYLIENQAANFNKVHVKFEPSRKERSQESKSGQRSKNVIVKKRRDPRKSLKIPTKRVYLTENRKSSEEIDRSSSYSESDLRYIEEKGNQINERSMIYSKLQQNPSKQSISRNSLNNCINYISNVLRCTNYEIPNHGNENYFKEHNESRSKEHENHFNTDRFLRREISDFKDFLIYRRQLQNRRVNRAPKIRTVYIPESVKLQESKELHNRMPKNDHKNEKECVNENRSKMHFHLKNQYVHIKRRPKVPDEELWKRFEQNFRRFASTKRYSGEVIPRKISTEWMRNMGVVGDLLTEKDADTEFKKAAGPKITMNINEYKEFLINLTIKKKFPFHEIYRRMCGI